MIRSDFGQVGSKGMNASPHLRTERTATMYSIESSMNIPIIFLESAAHSDWKISKTQKPGQRRLSHGRPRWSSSLCSERRFIFELCCAASAALSLSFAVQRVEGKLVRVRVKLSGVESIAVAARLTYLPPASRPFMLRCSNLLVPDPIATLMMILPALSLALVQIILKSCYSSASSSSSIPFYSGDGQPNANAKPIRFKELKKATRNFRPDRILGKGGVGLVFKGWINEHTLTAANPGSGMTVAIKKQFEEEWLREVKYLEYFRHPNLIKLIAYCAEGDKLLLVYEFMPKGSLDNHLFGSHQCLSWSTRIKVAVDTARGLSFLHDAKNNVIHRNLKSAHILLDEHFNAMLSGFDLATDGPPDHKTHVSTRVIGTHGYVAPEYLATGHLAENCDVYGFGVVLLELLSGRRASAITTAKDYLLPDRIKLYFSKKEEVNRVVDPKLKGQYPLEEPVIVSNLALQCCHHYSNGNTAAPEIRSSGGAASVEIEERR
ncbi:unnamed protein product [Fraxinus pennsylvanica]|uniref:Protein kinase domain-containing protein n=1 Tax=Fraxinus pennsylvanica TaxID=56036 RepID=A0AAD2E942_9LAMI|nr:unnamed protein product [Fraxinus pennsylvanica]